MEKQAIFKTNVFGGFEKEEVLKYIDDLNKNFQSIETKLNKNIDENNKEIQRLNEQISALKHIGLNKDKEIENTNISIEDLKKQLLRQKRIVSEKENLIIIESEKVKQLQNKNSEYIEHSKEFNHASVNVGSILVKAQITAQNIIDTATDDANNIKSKSYEYAQDIVNRINDLKHDFFTMRGNVSDNIELINTSLDDIEGAISKTFVVCNDSEKEKSDKANV